MCREIGGTLTRTMRATSEPVEIHIQSDAQGFGSGWVRQYVVYVVVSMAIGAGMTWLINSVVTGGAPSLRIVAAGVLVGFFACTCCYFPLELAHNLLKAWPRLLHQTVRGLLLAAGSFCGWLLATTVARLVLRVDFSPESRSLVVLVSMAIGAAFIAYDQLASRLRASIEQLKRREVERAELVLAGDIQRRLLPPEMIAGDGYRVVARHRAARFVAGDFYDVFRVGNGALEVVVADVVGKGMGASLIMATVKAMVPLLAADRTIGETARELNRRLKSELGPREFVALMLIRLDPDTASVELVNAGLPDPYLRSPTGELTSIDCRGPRLPLGVRDEVDYEATAISVPAGCAVLALTDGLPEARTAAGEPLGYQRLEELLSRGPADAAAWLDGVLERISCETEGDVDDDWTAVVIQVEDRAEGGV